ncbi:MAG: alpha-xenorhabdolysin family binary toxin subunit A [Alphaproteobacteria bacterium]
MSSQNLVPPDSSSIIKSDSSDGSSNRFLLFSSDWLQMQNYVQSALALPPTIDDFKKEYGEFDSSDIDKIKTAVRILGNVRDLSQVFGNPSSLKAKLLSTPTYLQTPEPPAEIYAHIVWLSNQIYNAASTFSWSLENLKVLLGPTSGTPEERANNLREILVGQGGLQSTAQTMQQQVNALLTKLLKFESNASDANGELLEYLKSSSSIVNNANKLIGSYQTSLQELQKSSDDALKKWHAYTIAAVSAAVGLLLIGAILVPFTGGAGFAVIGAGHAAGIALAIAASHQESVYNNLCTQISNTNKEIVKKTNLVTSLTSFNTQVGLVQPALTSFITDLGTIESMWSDIGNKIAFIVNNYSVEQLSDLSWVMQAMKISDATNKWKLIGSAATEFSQNSLVTYDLTKSFGQTLAA